MAYQSPIPIRAHRPVNPFAVFLDDVPEATSSEIDLARAQAERELAQKSRTPIDFASIFSKGAIGGLQTAPDLLLGPTSEPSQFMRGLSDTWGSLESPQYKAQQAAQADEFNALGPDASLIDKGLLAGKHALTDPLGTAAMAAGNLAPFALGGVAGISGKAGAMGLSGVMGGGAVRGGIYDSIQQAPDLALMSDPRYAEMRKTMPEFEAKNALGEIAASFEESGGKIALGVGTGIASGALGAEAKALSLGNSVGAARNQLIRAELEKEAAGGLVKNFLRGAAEEGLSEFPEEGAQQYLSNIGAGAGGAKIDPWANVAESAVQASIAGTLGGGFSHGLTNLNAKSNLAAMNQEENAKAKAEGLPEPYPVAKPIIPPKSPVNGEVGEPDTDLEGTEGEELSAEQIAAVKVVGPLDDEIAAAREAAANESSQGFVDVANVLTEEVPPTVAGPLPDNGPSTSAPLVDVAPVVDETLPPAETVDSVAGSEQNPPTVEAAPVVEAGAVGPNGTIEPIRRLREQIKKAVQPRTEPTVAEVAPPADAVNNPVVDAQLPAAPAAPANNVVSNTVAAPAAQSVNSNVAAPEAPVVANAIHEGTVAQPKEPVKVIGGPLRGGDTVMLGDLTGTVHSHPLKGMVNVSFEDGTVKRVKISEVKKIATPPIGETLEMAPEPTPGTPEEIVKELRTLLPEAATNKADFDKAAFEYQSNPTPDTLGAVLKQAKKAGLEPWGPGEVFGTAVDALKAGKDAFDAVRRRGISEASAKAIVKKAEAYMARMAKTEDVDLESQLRATIEAAKKNKPQFQRDAELSPEEFAQQQMDEYHRSFEEDMATRRMRRQQQADSLVQPGSLAEKASNAFKSLKGLANRAKIAVSDAAESVSSRVKTLTPQETEDIAQDWNGVNDDSRAEPWDNGVREAKKIEGTKFKVADFEGDVDQSVVAGLTRFKALADSISSVAARVANTAGLKSGTFAGFSPNGNFAGVTWRGRVWLNPLKHLGFTDNAAKMASRLVKTLVHEMIHTNGFGPHDDAFHSEFERVMAQIQPLIKGMEFEIGKTLDKETIKRLRGLNGTAEKGWSVAREKGRVASVARRQSDSSVSSVQPKAKRDGNLPPPDSEAKGRSSATEGTVGKAQGVDSASKSGRATEATSGKADSERSGVLKPQFAREAEEGEILTKAKLSPRLVTELGETFYKSSPEVTIVREAIQNAVDSIPKSKKNGAISVDFRNNKLTVSDNGIGMSPKTLSEAFINPGESDKPEGTRGGFGLAKVGMIYSADSFNAETVWEDKAGNKIKSTLAATRDEWLASFTEDGAPMSVKSEKVDSDEPTGTTIEYAYGSREMSGYSIGNELKKMLSHDIPNLEIKGSVDGSAIKPEMSYDSKKHTYVPIEFEEMTSKEIPGGTVEVKLSKSVAGPWGGRVEVMNGGLPQPAISISGVNAKKDGPEVVRINIIPNVPTTDRNYPFTPNREEVRDTAAEEIVTLVKQKINERVQAQNDKYKNRGMLEAKTPRGISVNAPDFDAPKEVLDNVAKSQSTEAIGIASSKAFDTIYDVLKDMLNGNTPKFAGLAILGDPADKGTTVYGVNLRGEELPADPNASLWASKKFGDEIRLNPWALFEKSHQIANKHSFPYEDVLAGQIYGTLLHEITHSDARGHDETFSGKLTEFAGISASLATKVVNELRKAITKSVLTGLEDDSAYIAGFPYGDSDKPGRTEPAGNSIEGIFKTLGLSKHGESVQESRSQEVEKPQFSREAVDKFPLFAREADSEEEAADKEIELPKITWRQKATYEFVNKYGRIGEMLKAVRELTGKKADVDLEEAAIAVSPQTAAKIGELKDYHVTPLAKLLGESKISIPDAEAYIHAKAAGEDVSEHEDGPNGEFYKALDEAVLNIIKLGNAAAAKSGMKAGKVSVDPEGPANGIIQRAIDRTQKIIVKAAENTFRRQVAEFLAKNISPDWAINPKNQEGGHTVSFQVDGKKQRMWFKDKVLASQIESLSDGETSEFMNRVRQGTRVFANVNTRLSPVFPIKNFIRDLFFGLGKVYVDDGAKNMMAVLKGVPEAFRDMIRHAKDPIASKGTLAHEMFSKGGMPAWFGLPSEENIRTMLEADIKEFDGSKQGKAYIPFKRVWNAMRILSEASEGATRLAYFKVLKDSGVPIQEAIKKTRGVTGDFQRHGSKKNMRYAYAFFNSSIQGADAMLKLTKELRDGNPRARNLAMFLVAMGMSQALVGMGAGDDDKDGQNDYEQLPEYLKNANLIMPIPGHPIAIPLPYGLNVPIVAGMGIMRSLFSTEPDKHAKAAMNLWQATTKSFNPMGDEASLLQLISPTLLDPLAQSSENTDSLGRKIVRDRYQGEENLPDSEIKSRKDSEFAKTASSLANKLTGGSRVKPGLADVSPATIDNTVSWAGGSMLRFMKDLGAARLVGGKWTGNVPIFNDFVKTPKSYFYTGRFWDQLDEIRSLKDSARQLDENARKEQLVELGLDPDRVESISRAELRKGVKLTADRSDKLSKEVQQIYGKRAKLLPMYEELRKQISALNQSGDPEAEDKVEALVKAANRKYMEATR